MYVDISKIWNCWKEERLMKDAPTHSIATSQIREPRQAALILMPSQINATKTLHTYVLCYDQVFCIN
jgi:hypothetical protein